MTMTLDSLITSVTNLVTSVAPDLGIYIAAGVVIAVGSVLFARFTRGAR